MKLRIRLAALLAFFSVLAPLCLAQHLSEAHTFKVVGSHFELDGKPFQVLSGEIHYARVPRAYWRDRIRMARAMGLNTIATYVFWNVHEPKPGVYDFSGQDDLAAFIKIAQEEHMYVLLRAGPYSCAEWEFGGFPAWLLADPRMQKALRSNDPAYMVPVERWMKRLAQEVAPLQIGLGGPILAVQIENEYGNFGGDKAYMEHLHQIFIDDGFTHSLLYTVDPSKALARGEIDGVYSGVNFGTGHAAAGLDALERVRPGQPLFATEYWTGWFDLWGHPHETRPIAPQLADAGSNGFTGTVSVQASGMPSGITVSPSSAQISPGGTGTSFTVTASSSATAGNSTITFTGTSGSLSHSAQLALTLQPPPATSALGRTKYVRTDSATEYGATLDEGWTVYDPGTQRFFVSDTAGNLLRVMDAKTEKQLAAIPVPGVYGIDITPDNSVIYAGTEIGDVYAIDPVNMKVTHRYLSAQIGASGYSANAVRVLANGSLALLGGQGGIASVDGYSSVGVWNIQTNSLQLYTTGYGYAVTGASFSVDPVTNICPSGGAIGAFLLSGDRQRIIIASIDSDSTICSFNPVTGDSNAVTGSQEFIYHLAATPDGSSIIATGYSPNRIVVLDAKTLAPKNTFNITADTASDANLFVSADSSTLYMSSSSGAQIFAYDLASGAMKGWMPSPYLETNYGGSAIAPFNLPTLGAIDETGLIEGPMEEGVGFIDTTTMRTGTVGSNFTNAYLSPSTGPVSGGTAVTSTTSIAAATTISAVYFGANAATGVSKDSTGVHATSPAGTAGPVDVYIFASDSGVQIVPEAFSYGPTILEATPDSSTAEGGGTGILYGYGFGPAGTSTAPSDLQVNVGGQAATITAFTSNAYGLASPPFLLEAVAFNIPAGVAGTSADITVTTSSGSTTLTNGMHYLPAIQQFPLSRASLAQGIYDPHRDLFYFSDANSILVFSRTNQTWLPSMNLPDSGHRLWAMSLSPDGSKLVVSDPPTGSIYLFDPSGANPPQSFPVKTTSTPYGVEPGGLAVTDAGTVYFGRAVLDVFGASSLARLDLSTGTVTDFTGVGSSGINSDVNFHLALSKDNSRAYFNDEGQMLYIDTASNTVVYKPVGDGCCYGDYDLHLANNQSSLEATSFLYDGDENGKSGLALNLREAMNIQYVDGTAFSPDGSLLFQPSTNGIDVFDGRLFTLRTRIALPVALGQNYDALVAGGPDDQLLAITGATGTGIALIDLTSLSEPDPLPYVSPTMSAWEPTVRLNSSAPAGSARIPAFQVPRRFLLPGQHALPPELFHFGPAPAPLTRPAIVPAPQ